MCEFGQSEECVVKWDDKKGCVKCRLQDLTKVCVCEVCVSVHVCLCYICVFCVCV
jgi:hypothetical protein